jgi:uncharacterized paraquat-inducible protein A
MICKHCNLEINYSSSNVITCQNCEENVHMFCAVRENNLTCPRCNNHMIENTDLFTIQNITNLSVGGIMICVVLWYIYSIIGVL